MAQEGIDGKAIAETFIDFEARLDASVKRMEAEIDG